MHFQYTVFGPLDEFHGFIQICYYECPHISGIYLESLLIGMKIYTNELGHMTDMAAMPIYGKNHKKSSSPEPVDQ